jgi:hypothetical protein
VDAATGNFIFSKTSCAYRQTIAFAFYPHGYEHTGKFIRKVLALGAQRFDPKNAALVNGPSHCEAAARVTDILHLRSLRELET